MGKRVLTFSLLQKPLITAFIMSCIDKHVDSMNSLGFTTLSRIPNPEDFFKDIRSCMETLPNQSQVIDTEDQEPELESRPSPLEASEFVMNGGRVTVNIAYDDSTIDALYGLPFDKEQAYRFRLLEMACIYMEVSGNETLHTVIEA